MTAPLHAYRHARVVVQSARVTAAHAALAMMKNEVGCVLVSDGGAIVGVVTDRDLATRVVASERSARDTRLREVMSKPVMMLSVDAPLGEALRIMREGRVRRVPLVEVDRVVGMVTLDDLLLEKAATLDDISGVVRGQIVEGGPARTHRFDEWTSLGRKHARALGTKTKLLREVEQATGLVRGEAERALVAVLSALVQSLDGAHAARFIGRLPVAFRGQLRELPTGPIPVGARRRLEETIARDLGITCRRAAGVAQSVGAALAQFVRASDPLGRRVPSDLRRLLANGGASSRPSARRGTSRRLAAAS